MLTRDELRAAVLDATADALAQAFADHDRIEHGAQDPDVIPAECLRDVARRTLTTLGPRMADLQPRMRRDA